MCAGVAVAEVEDLANQGGIGNVRYNPQLSAAERAECDVYFERRCRTPAGVGTIARRMGELGAKTPW